MSKELSVEREAEQTTPPSRGTDPNRLTVAEQLLLEDTYDSRNLRRALVAAAVAHAVLLVMNFPNILPEPIVEAEKPKVYVVASPRFKPPPPKPEQPLPKPVTRRVPVPDPTPDDPEPLRFDEPVEVELPEVDLVLDMPAAPPPPAPRILTVSGEVEAPVGIHQPPPIYTEIARRTRVEGVVRLQAVIDDQGQVKNVEVLKGLPMGLTEEAVRAVSQWTFSPATLRGRPVSVYYTLAVTFELH